MISNEKDIIKFPNIFLENKKLQYDYDDKLFRIDIEFGNSSGFFSSSRSIKKTFSEKNKIFNNQFNANIFNTNLIVNDLVSIVSSEEIIRETKFSVIEDSKLFDFVSRFIILSDDRMAEIDNKRIKHDC